MKPSRRRPPSVLVIGAGILIGVALIITINAPRVVEFSPSDSEGSVSSLSRLRLRFNRPMMDLSVEARIQIDPVLPGRFYWEEETLIFEPDIPWPADSTVTVRLLAGSQGTNRVPMLRQRRWSFRVGLPRLIYLWPGNGKSDLYQLALQPGSEPVQITESEAGVTDYTTSTDGALVIYSAHLEGGGAELRAFDMIAREDRILLSCEAESLCSAPAISPDGEWLAFERAEFTMGEAGRMLLSQTRVWLLSLLNETQPFPVSPSEHTANTPNWSPTGWLVYFDDDLKALALVNPGEEQEITPINYLPTGLGIVGSWSPDGTRLVYPDIIFPEEDQSAGEGSPDASSPLYYSHLYVVDVTNGRTVDISPGDWMVEDASPSFSPDGEWVAFTRKFLDPGRWSPGRQVWLMNSERTETQAMTSEPGATFSSLAWSPDSEHLAFMRKYLADLAQPAEIWIVDVISGESKKVVEDAFLPGWLP